MSPRRGRIPSPAMLLHDTAAGGLRAFEPATDEVSLYVCGITPYDAAHLGHAFTYHVFDVLTRRLVAAGHRVNSVRNITDVDDDIFRVARTRGIGHRELVATQVERFAEEIASIDILPVTAEPRASAFVPSMVDWIVRLERAGFAYAREGWVYFEVARFPGYGSMARLSRDQMIAMSRSRGGDPDDPRKRDPLDFVLWQPSLPDELVWDSPWGRGRPGWHIEGTVLAAEHCPDGIDIHGGGEDLIYPHHASEIAQAESIDGVPFARHWTHIAMVALDGVKMSKSLGNLVFVSDLVARSSGPATRLLLAGHHYRAGWSYVPGELDDAVARLNRYQAAVRDPANQLDGDAAAALEDDFYSRLDDDLDTPGALRVLDAGVEAARRGGSGGMPVATLLPRLLSIVGVRLPGD